jgi:hypothetical protein
MLAQWSLWELLRLLTGLIVLCLYVAGRIVLHQIRREMSRASSLRASSETTNGQETPRPV